MALPKRIKDVGAVKIGKVSKNYPKMEKAKIQTDPLVG